MSRISRFVVFLTAIASLTAMMAATASAVTWHNTGNTAFTATAGAGTLTSTGVTLTCANSTGTGALAALTNNVHITVSGSVTYNGCLLGGVATAVTCTYDLTGKTQTGSVTTGDVSATCNVSQFGTKLCHIENHTLPLHGEYTNPTSPNPGRLTITTGILRVTGGTSCPLGRDDTAHLTHGAYLVTAGTGGTGALGPIITRTA